MPSALSHLRLAERNQQTIDYLLKDLAAHSPWVATIAFYKALHLVEAVFAGDPNIRHGRTHEQRDQYLKQNKRYSHIYKHYRPLWAASTVARYLEDKTRNDEYSSFSEYLTPEKVRDLILGHYLHQVEISVGKMLPPAPTSPSK